MSGRVVAALVALAVAWAAALWGVVRLSSALVSRATPPAKSEAPEAPAASADSGRTPAEDAAVRAAESGALRAATDDDGEPTEERDDLAALYGNYHPFFVRGDLDGDGRADFVQAFVRRRGDTPLFDVAVFFGRADGTFSPPVFAARDVPLASGDVSVDRTLVVLTPDLAADETRRLRYEPATGKFVDADAGNAEPPRDDAPEVDPDHRPRARV